MLKNVARPLAFALLMVALITPNAAAQRAAYYVLDGFGGVHAGGGAQAIVPATAYFGFDVARDIAFVPYGAGGTAGDGVLVLDGFGGVHTGGALPNQQANPRTPYFGFDVARAIAYRNVPPRAAGSTGFGNASIFSLSQTFFAVSSATVVAPDDGFLLVTATANYRCTTTIAAFMEAQFGLGLDGTTANSADIYDVYIDSCNNTLRSAAGVAITRLFAVAAGAHTAHLVARMIPTTETFLRVHRSSVTVAFVDQAGDGSS